MANEFIIRKGYKSLSDSQITGSLSVSNAVTASFFTGSFRGDGSELTGIDGFPFTGSASISGSLTVVGPVNAITFTGDGSQLTGIEGFPFTGSARITGSLVVVGPVTATSFIGSLQGTATTASYVLNAVSSSFATTASYVNIANVDGFTAYSSSVNTAIGSVLNATTPLTATVNTTNTPFTITSQSIVIVDSTNGNVTVNLPNLNTVVGTPNQKPIVVYKNDYSQNVIFVSPSGSQLINGASQDIIVSIQLAVIYNPTSAGWVTEGTSAQSLAELELFFVPRTETGSLSVATASYVQYTNVVNKPTLVSGSSQISFSGRTNKPTLVSGSSQISFSGITNKPTLVSGSSQITYSGLTGIPAGIVSSSVQVKEYNVFATTGSNQFNGNQSITGSLTVSGQVVAQTLNVQQVTSSIVYSSGSNIFGNSLGNTQQFTGSLQVSGSSHYLLGSVGVGVTSPLSRLHVNTGTNQNFRVRPGTDVGATNGVALNSRTDDDGSLQQLTLRASDVIMLTSGNVGIGTASPGSILQANFSNATTYSSGVTGNGLTLYNTSATNNQYVGLYFLGEPSSGNAGQATIYGITTGTGAMDLAFSTRGSSVLAERMRITSGGNMGIGSISPSEKLEVQDGYLSTYHNANVNDAGYGVQFYTNGGGSKNSLASILLSQVGTARSGNLTFNTSNAGAPTTKMIITSTGNVGIGTILPSAQLNVGHESHGIGMAYMGGSSLPSIAGLFTDTSSGQQGYGSLLIKSRSDYAGYSINFFTATSANTPVERMRITSGGNVGIGTDTTIGLLTLGRAGGGQYISARDNTTGYEIGYLQFNSDNITLNPQGGALGNDNYIRLLTAGTERMRITSGGNVLIGTTSNIASSKLRVSGNIQIEGFQKMYTYYIVVNPSTTGTITISSPTGTNIQGSMQVMAGGYGNGITGNITGLWMVGGLLFYNNASTSTITQIVNSVTDFGSMSFQRSSDQYTVSLTNTASSGGSTKSFYVSVIINGD